MDLILKFLLFLTLMRANSLSDALDCTVVAYEKCDSSLLNIVETIPSVDSFDLCQTLCIDALGDDCSFALLNTELNECNIIGASSDLSTYEKSCRRILGQHQEGSILECLDSIEQCDHFVEEDCKINGDFLASLSTPTVDICNQSCGIAENCDFFSFDDTDPDNSSCFHYAMGTAKCDYIRGPKIPALSSCP